MAWTVPTPGQPFIGQEGAIPIRRDPSESVEMISQLLFGEMGLVQQRKPGWVYVQLQYDQYEGWVDEKMILPLQAEEMGHQDQSAFAIDARIDWGDWQQQLPIGAVIPFNKKGEVQLGNRIGTLIEGSKMLEVGSFERWKEVAIQFVGVPYLWGGVSGFGIDCSGFIQRVYRMSGGPKQPRDSRQQAQIGTQVKWGDHQPGDLVFFTKPNQAKISHVGIVWAQGEIIHASGRVRIDDLTSEGIIHKDQRVLTHQLETIRR